jgi:hypothetical protein
MDGEALTALAGAVDALDLEPVGQEIERALWLRDQLDAKISKALRRFDADEAWSADGSLSLTSWLAAHGRRSRRDSYHEAAVARDAPHLFRQPRSSGPSNRAFGPNNAGNLEKSITSYII